MKDSTYKRLMAEHGRRMAHARWAKTSPEKRSEFARRIRTQGWMRKALENDVKRDISEQADIPPAGME